MTTPIDELLNALRGLYNAEMEYGDPTNVAVNQACDTARRVLLRYDPEHFSDRGEPQ